VGPVKAETPSCVENCVSYVLTLFSVFYSPTVSLKSDMMSDFYCHSIIPCLCNLKFLIVHSMRVYGGVVVKLHSFSASALTGGEGPVWRSGLFIPMETAPGYPLKRRPAAPQTSSGNFIQKIIFPARVRAPDHPARSLVTVLTTVCRLSL
jgi:hypothetical protein